MDIYFFDFIVHKSKKEGRRCDILIKEKIQPPFKSWGFIVPIHFSDSLQFISPKPMQHSPQDPIRYRMISCKQYDDLILLFKTADEQTMIAIFMRLATETLDIIVHRWDDLDKKYVRVKTDQYTATDERYIHYILRSISVRSGRKISYCLF
ncbi:hypothetical protein [Anoxybacillus gonensis]|uniref:hypothetical protein n=1 Tax=Anoxybacillus gonensis TaxID=198467 RepID=UPI0002BF2218|nr:hypothetical protein [Anoxybacillus gonensis]EMI10431.1 hypothetical protein F510_1454 [Anoxybacillus gonensis]